MSTLKQQSVYEWMRSRPRYIQTISIKLGLFERFKILVHGRVYVTTSVVLMEEPREVEPARTYVHVPPLIAGVVAEETSYQAGV